MASRIVKHKDAINGYYISRGYCYEPDCPARTEKEPWPHSDEEINREGKSVCKHCGRKLTWTFPAEAFQ